MDFDGMMLSSHTKDHEESFEKRYFYRVTSERTSVLYNSPSEGNACLFRSQCNFTSRHVTKQIIEEVFCSLDSRPSAFVQVFESFADALERAHLLHVHGDTAILIVQLDASDVVRPNQAIVDLGQCSLVPLWISFSGGGEIWLQVPEVAPILHIDPTYTTRSTWLACGHISSWRFSAAWPIIGGKLYFEEDRSEHLVDLFTSICGFEPEEVRQHDDLGRYIYDWEEQVFVHTDTWPERNTTLKGPGGFAGAGVGLGLPTSQYTRSRFLGCAGYLRGMLVMD